MAQRITTKTTFAPVKVIQPICTRGSVALTQDGRILATCLDEDVLLTDLRTGEEIARIEGDGELVTTLSITPGGSHVILCSRSLSMRIYALNVGEDNSIEPELLHTLKPHSSPVVTSAVDRTGTLFASGGADGIVKVWDIRQGYVTHVFHGQRGLISALHFFEVDKIASKGDESKKRNRKSQSKAPEQSVNGIASAFRLASGGEDGKVRVWDLDKRKSAATLDAHVSVVRTLQYSTEEGILLSGSRDKTVMLWDAKTWKNRSTIPILEEVEDAGFLKDGKLFFTGGEFARIRLWSLAGYEITREQAAGSETEAILQTVHYTNLPYILSVHADQTLILHSTTSIENSTSAPQAISPLPILRRISGTHGQIIDIAYVGQDKNLLALATNSEEVRIVSLSTATSEKDDDTAGGNYFGADVALLQGHDDIIICMDSDWSGHWLATGSKDNTARLWRLDPSFNSYSCYAVFTGHAESLGAVALPLTIPPRDSPAFQNPLDYPPAFLVSGSQDRTVKRWDVPKPSNNENGKAKARATYTRKAHEKDINALATNSNSTLFASASQDRTVKIWSVEDGTTLGVLRGHRRGVWSVSFSPTGTNLNIPGATTGAGGGLRGHILTGSGDKTVRVWSLSNYSCLMTMEGHTNSVLKVLWLPPSPEEENSQRDKRGPLVASAGGDGLVKVWEAQTGECATTLDNHTDRVWALTARSPSSDSSTDSNSIGETLISGAGDGVLTFWKDTTTATTTSALLQETTRIELDQTLQNHIYGRNWREAIVLALQLDQPAKLLHLFKIVVESPDFERDAWTGNKSVDAVIAGLGDEQILTLLRRCRDWNTNARNAVVAQRVLRAIFEGVGVERLAALRVRGRRRGGVGADGVGIGGKGRNDGLRDVLRALRVYGVRHFSRISELLDESFLVEFTLREMDGMLSGDDASPQIVSAVGVSNGVSSAREMDFIQV